MREDIYLLRPSISNILCYPEVIGHFCDFPGHEVNRTLHYINQSSEPFTEYNLHLVFGGKGYVQIENEILTLTAGTGFLYGKGVAQRYYSDKKDPWDIRWIHFYGDKVEHLLEEKIMGGLWIFSFAHIRKLEKLMIRLLEMVKRTRTGDSPTISARLYEILLELLFYSERLNATNHMKTQEKIRKTADYIHLHCTEELNLDYLSDLAGLSKFYYCRTFHQVMGKTPIEFLIELRIALAKKMLITTDMPIKQIALEVGFAQSSYFIERFRYYVKLTPTQFRSVYMQ